MVVVVELYVFIWDHSGGRFATVYSSTFSCDLHLFKADRLF